MDVAIIFLMPVLFLLFGLLIIRVRRLSWVEDVGLRLPDARAALLWVLGFLALMLATELLTRWSGVAEPVTSWRGKYDALNLAVRLLAVPILYPMAEEFFFRGAILGAAVKRFGTTAGILASALLFAAVHVQYAWIGMALVLVDALFYAVCRIRTGSLYLAMLLHMIGNSYAAWERLAA